MRFFKQNYQLNGAILRTIGQPIEIDKCEFKRLEAEKNAVELEPDIFGYSKDYKCYLIDSLKKESFGYLLWTK